MHINVDQSREMALSGINSDRVRLVALGVDKVIRGAALLGDSIIVWSQVQ